VEDDIVDKYFVHVTTRSSWLFSATMPAASSAKKKKKLQAAAGGDSTKLRRDTVKKPAMSKEKEGEANKKAKVKKEEGQDQDGAARVWMCKKNDGRRWHCNRPVSQPDTLCEYHFVQKRSYLNPDFESPSVVKLEEAAPLPVPVPVPAAASKSCTRSNKKPRKKKPGSDLSATEGFYYYAGFGPFRSKRQCRSGGTNMKWPQDEEDDAKDDASPSEQQAEVDDGHDDTNQTVAAARGDASSCEDDTAGIAGVDEGSSDDDFDGLGISGHGMNGNGDSKASNGDGKRKIPWKRWRKPVKARSLKSLM
jgi:hypothetical protein